MPRTAISETPEFAASREQLRAFMASRNISGVDLAEAVGDVSQYDISRFLTGRTKTATTAVRRILIYANIDINGISSLISDQRIAAALAAAWDGTTQGKLVLAEAIQTLAPMIKRMR